MGDRTAVFAFNVAQVFRPEVVRCVSRRVKSLTSEEVSYINGEGNRY